MWRIEERDGRGGEGREGGTAREGEGSDGTERNGKGRNVPEVPYSQVGAPLNWVQVCVYRSVHP